MRKTELWFFGGTALFCGLYLVLSIRIPFGNIGDPGPGFLPIVLGILGILVSAGILIPPLARKAIVGGEGIGRQAILRVGGYVLAIGLYIAFSRSLGAYPCIFLLMMALSKISGLGGWLRPAALATSVTIVSYGLFDLLLSVPLPLGFLEGVL